MTAPWAPTHRAPASGLDTWADANPAAAPGPRLDVGLEVMIVATEAYGWTRVRCSNDWEAWVDGRLLEPLPAPFAAPPAPFAAPPAPFAAPPAPFAAPPAPVASLPAPVAATAPSPIATPPIASSPMSPMSVPAPGLAPGMGATARRGGPSPALVAGAVAAVAAVVLVGVLLVRRPAADTTATTSPSSASVAPPVTKAAGKGTLVAPSGWTASADGTKVAANAADLTAAEPSGPRARIVPDDNTSFEDAYDKAFDAGIAVEPTGPPSTMLINGRNAVVVTLTETANGSKPVTRRYIATSDAAGNGVEFVLEAPADAWAANENTLLDVPSLG